MLKEKSGKKRLPSTDTSKEITLDARHQLFVERISSKATALDEQRRCRDHALQQAQSWKAQVLALQNEGALQNGALQTDASAIALAWTSNLYWQDNYMSIDRSITSVEVMQEEIDYYENTGDILFEYYNLLSDQDKLSADALTLPPPPPPQRPLRGRKKHGMPIPTRSILEILAGASAPSCAPVAPSGAPSAAPSGALSAAPSGAPQAPETDAESNPKVTGGTATGGWLGIAPSASASASVSTASTAASTSAAPPPRDKRALVERYLAFVDPMFVRPPDPSASTIGDCDKCKLPMVTLLQEGIMVCSECGHQELMLVEQNKPIHRQPTKETSHYSYKRINHFNEWLSQCQGQESTEISDEIFERILAEVKKEKLDMTRLKFSKMREILKKLQLTRYYEHIVYIVYRINGIPAPKFSQELEEKLRSMFKEIQAPFLKHCPLHRKNFLSYAYVLYKLCQLLEKDEYLKYFHLLKSREKLHQQDQVWKKICEELGWQFIESI